MTGGRLDRSAYVLEFDERFDDSLLDRWVPHYLPHWTTPDRSGARYELVDGGLRLRIDVDQLPWRDADGGLRVSNLQSGSWSGSLGSPRGQHRHVSGLAVVSPQPDRRGYTPCGGLIEAELRATIDSTTMLAFWLVGFEADSPDDSGEICVVELFGDSIGTSMSQLSIGIKAHNDPRLHSDMARIPSPIDATMWHTYSAEWLPEEVRFFVDDVGLRTVAQPLRYPMQLMVDLFEFRADGPADPARYPKLGEVRAVRGYRRVQA
jgi:glycosyl hydrolase family 16